MARMLSSLELLDLAKEKLAARHGWKGPVTKYRLRYLFGEPLISEATFVGWFKPDRTPGTEFAGRIAEATELPVEYVYACLEHERSRSAEVKGILQTIAGKFHHIGPIASILLATLLAFGSLSLTYSNTGKTNTGSPEATTGNLASSIYHNTNYIR